MISYSYLNYGQMTIVRLDRTMIQQPVHFIDVSYNVTVIPKLRDGIDQVGIAYDVMMEKCVDNRTAEGYCNGLPINAAFTTVITEGEFQTLDGMLQLNPFGISASNTWVSNIKYLHDGCFPIANGFQPNLSKSDSYCYYKIIVEKR